MGVISSVPSSLAFPQKGFELPVPETSLVEWLNDISFELDPAMDDKR
jgi:hypothetical protein